MSNVSCPHCGTANPSNAAYCARCQRPLSGGKASSPLPPASQVAQQILQKRPPVPTAAAPKPLASAAEVAARLAARRAEENPFERTVIERVPQPANQRSVLAAGPAKAPPPKLDIDSGDDDISNEPTRVFAVPKTMHDEPTRNAREMFNEPTRNMNLERRATVQAPREPISTQKSAVLPAPPKPAAAPSLPQPAVARDVHPSQREPAAVKPSTARRPAPPAELQERRGAPQPHLREGAVPPQRPAPQPPEATAVGIEYAAGWRLLLSHVVDFALLCIVCVLFAKADASLTGPHDIDTSGVWDWIGSHPGSALRAGILTVLVGTAYHIVMAQLSGRTLGRMVAGTTLARRSGKPLNTFVIVVRALASFASLLLFGAGFFWSIVDRRGRGFHDLVAGTMVVRHQG